MLYDKIITEYDRTGGRLQIEVAIFKSGEEESSKYLVTWYCIQVWIMHHATTSLEFSRQQN